MFFGPHFWEGSVPPEFLKSIYKIDTASGHVAKFAVIDRGSSEITHWKKENITSKIEDLPYYRMGGLINNERLGEVVVGYMSEQTRAKVGNWQNQYRPCARLRINKAWCIFFEKR